MGNAPTITTPLVQIKKEEKVVEFPPSVLTETSIEDKIWLNLSEENIFSNFNESFTNERYYMLHADDPESQIEVQTVKSEVQTEAEAEILQHNVRQYESLVDIIEDRTVDPRKVAVNKLVKQLSNLSKTAYFDSILQRKLLILKRIHLAINRERARDELWDHNTEHFPSSVHQSATTLPPPSSHNNISPFSVPPSWKESTMPAIIRVSMRLFISTLEQQINTEMGAVSLEMLNQMLCELPPLSLRDEPRDCLNSLQRWLMTALESSIQMELKCRALESLIGLAIAEGSLRDILSAVAFVLLPKREEKTTGKNEQHLMSDTVLHVTPFLHQLNSWEIDLILSPLNRECLAGTWTLSCPDHHMHDDSKSTSSSPREPIAAMSTDGHYLYIHDKCGLLKVSTGVEGTQGQIVMRRADWFPSVKGDVVCIQNKIYWRSSQLSSSTILIMNADTLQEEGDICADGSGSIPTCDNSRLPSFWPHPSHERALSPSSPKYSFPSTPLASSLFSPMFTDGRFLYILVHTNMFGYYHDKYCVEIYDPLAAMQHLKTVELHYKETEQSNIYSQTVLHLESLQKGAFYTNGHYLVAILPPPVATHYGYDTVQPSTAVLTFEMVNLKEIFPLIQDPSSLPHATTP